MSIYDRDYMKRKSPKSANKPTFNDFLKNKNEEDETEYYLLQVPKGLKNDLLKIGIIILVLMILPLLICCPECILILVMVALIYLICKL